MKMKNLVMRHYVSPADFVGKKAQKGILGGKSSAYCHIYDSGGYLTTGSCGYLAAYECGIECNYYYTNSPLWQGYGMYCNCY